MRSRPDKPPQKGEEFIQTCEGCRGNAGDIRQTYLVMFVLFCCSLNLHTKKKLLPWADRVRVKKKQQENCISTTATFAETHSYSAAVSTNTAHGAAMQLAMVSVVHSGTAKDQWCLLVWEMRLPICLNLGYKSKNILAVLEIRWKCSRREYQTNICLFFFSSLRVNKRRINIVFVMLTVV